MIPQPLKIYRKDLNPQNLSISNSSAKISTLQEQPGGYIFTQSKPTSQFTVVNKKDFIFNNYTNNLHP